VVTDPPRIGVSRTVYPAADRATARTDLRGGIGRQADMLERRGTLARGLSEDETFERLNVIHGHPEQVIAALSADRTLQYASDLIVQFDPGRVSHAQALAALERTALEVAPALGWRPALRQSAA
jgi:hypothetical protein